MYMYVRACAYTNYVHVHVRTTSAVGAANMVRLAGQTQLTSNVCALIGQPLCNTLRFYRQAQ